MLVALVSAKGSPGVTTIALAATLTWPRSVVLAETDPAGGTVMAGYLAGLVPTGRGIGELAVAALRGDDLHGAWWGQLVDLQPPTRRRLLLPGVNDPAQAGTVGPVWPQLGEFLASLERTQPGYDVIADCGRLITPHAPWPLLGLADAVLLVLPCSLPGIAAAIPAARAIREQLTSQGASAQRVGLLLREGDQSPRTAIATLHAPAVAVIPQDPRTGHVLSHGGTVRPTAPLLRAAADACHRIGTHARRYAAAPRPRPAAAGHNVHSRRGYQ